MTGAVVKMLQKIADTSSANLVKNADSLLSKKSADVNVEWIEKKKADCLKTDIKCLIDFFLGFF